MPKKKHRLFSRELKIETVKRMLRGENVCALTRELKTSKDRSTVYLITRRKIEPTEGESVRRRHNCDATHQVPPRPFSLSP